jgi:hypothetical protein
MIDLQRREAKGIRERGLRGSRSMMTRDDGNDRGESAIIAIIARASLLLRILEMSAAVTANSAVGADPRIVRLSPVRNEMPRFPCQ